MFAMFETTSPGATWFVPGFALQAVIACAAVGQVVVVETPGWPAPEGGAPFDPGLESQSGNDEEGVTSPLGNHNPVFSSVQFDCVAVAADTPVHTAATWVPLGTLMFPAFPNVPGAAATDNVPGTEDGLTMRIAL
jgi:hypothetical protein